MKKAYQQYKVAFWIAVISIHQLCYLMYFNGTADDGDSITHYLHCKYAFDYPYLFINLWAKPIFVFLSCGFAQVGMIGMKVFNSICVLSAAYLAYRLAEEHGAKHPELAMPILMCMPRYFHHSLSALTEPLFSLLAVAALLFMIRTRYVVAALVIAWMPFSRPEGAFFILVAVLFFMKEKRTWRYVPLLGVGYFILSIIGFIFFDQDILWIFKDDPYPTLQAQYETRGQWTHFIYGLVEILGTPIYCIFWVGLAYFLYRMYKRRHDVSIYHGLLLVGFIFAVIGIHTVFYRFGVFKSFGLLRVLLNVAPLCAIVVVFGLNGIASWIHAKFRQWIYILAIIGVVAYMYSGHIYTFDFPKDFKLQSQQVLADEVANYVNEQLPQTYVKYYYHPQLHLSFAQDPFDWRTFQQLRVHLMDKQLPGNAVLIWDDWYARVDGRVTEEMMQANDKLEWVKTFSTIGKWGVVRKFSIYKTKVWDED